LLAFPRIDDEDDDDDDTWLEELAAEEVAFDEVSVSDNGQVPIL
jgi:hypothetical protein